jgi:glutathione S-transferase
MAEAPGLTIVGRSGSHFTRVTRMFARELGVAHGFLPIMDLLSLDAATYAGNPALKLPILEGPGGTRFGALPICRELARHAASQPRIVWPEDQLDALSCNALELTLQGMATEVVLIMQKAAGGNPDSNPRHAMKLRASLERSVDWLDANVDAALAALPERRDLSFLEVSLFCFASHLPWREVLSLDAHENLRRFCAEFGKRASAIETPYRVDAASPVTPG